MPGISLDEAAWAKVINRYRNAPEKVALVQRGVVQWAMDEGIKEAQHQIDTLVYDAPVSESGYERTGATRRAISKMGRATWSIGTGAVGVIHVDRTVANRKGFYYPAILNRGRTDIRYYPRPFWTATRAIMRVRYDRQGREALKVLGQQLRID